MLVPTLVPTVKAYLYPTLLSFVFACYMYMSMTLIAQLCRCICRVSEKSRPREHACGHAIHVPISRIQPELRYIPMISSQQLRSSSCRVERKSKRMAPNIMGDTSESSLEKKLRGCFDNFGEKRKQLQSKWNPLRPTPASWNHTYILYASS